MTITLWTASSALKMSIYWFYCLHCFRTCSQLAFCFTDGFKTLCILPVLHFTGTANHFFFFPWSEPCGVYSSSAPMWFFFPTRGRFCRKCKNKTARELGCKRRSAGMGSSVSLVCFFLIDNMRWYHKLSVYGLRVYFHSLSVKFPQMPSVFRVLFASLAVFHFKVCPLIVQYPRFFQGTRTWAA